MLFALGMGHSSKCLVMTLISSSSLDMDEMLCTYWLSGRSRRENIWQDIRMEHSEVHASWPRAKYFPVRPDLTQSIKMLSCHHFFLLCIVFAGLYAFLVGLYAFFQPYHLNMYGPHVGTLYLWFSKEIYHAGHMIINVIIGKLLKESIMCASLSI